VELPFDLWHLAFVTLIQRRAPPNFEVQSEVRASAPNERWCACPMRGGRSSSAVTPSPAAAFTSASIAPRTNDSIPSAAELVNPQA
jgi:hypothetical protein